MIQFKVFNNISDAVAEQEYRTLVANTSDATLFNDWPWLTTWEQFADIDERLYVIGRDTKSQLVSFVALGINIEKQFGLRTRVARFIQSPWADRVAILLHSNYFEHWDSFLNYLQQILSVRCDLMIWEQLHDSHDLIAQTLRWGSFKKFTTYALRTCQCPVFYIDGRNREAIVASYPSKMRTDLKRRRKKLNQLNSELVHLRPTVQQTDELIQQIKEVENQSWKAEEAVGIFNHPTAGQFFKSVAVQLAKADQLDLALIYIDGKLASYKFGFYFRNTFFDYSIGYLPQYSKLALGRILLDEVVLSAADQGYLAVDASRVGAQTRHLLLERTTQTTDHWRLYFFNRTLKGLILRCLITYLKPTAKYLRQQWRDLSLRLTQFQSQNSPQS